MAERNVFCYQPQRVWSSMLLTLQKLQSDVKSDYSPGILINSLSDLQNTDVTNKRTGNVSPEGRSADGIVKIPTIPSQDNDAKTTAETDIANALSGQSVLSTFKAGK